eukprot:GFUD01011046.1.p1 GENE.GFUD01011046.1~~GFUD01011046.1.p1  ORF type:complete len:416 (+),score=51.02 GFUD01011046.1:295-1542(+)
MGAEEREQIRRSFFLPLYFTIISLMVPLSLWAAWGIYSQPIRYRSLFPHNEARKQAIAGLLLTVLFFIPFFNLWVNDKVLLIIGGLYAFLFVPLTVGLVKPNLLEQQTIIFRVRRKFKAIRSHITANLKQLVRLSCLVLFCIKELLIGLPYFYRHFITFQVLTNQVLFSLLAEKVLCPKENFISLYLLLFFTVLIYVKKGLQERPWARQMFTETNTTDLLRLTSTFVSVRMGKSVVMAVVLLTFTFQVNDAEPPILFVLLCAAYFTLTEPQVRGEELLTSCASYFQSDIFEHLEFLYIPLFVRLICILSNLTLCLLTASTHPLLVTIACYTNLYVPLTRLSTEILTPLEQEIKGLQAFRQPTKAELSKVGPTCPVCLDSMLVSRITPCGHIFHSHCLRQCLTRNKTCPCCRAELI